MPKKFYFFNLGLLATPLTIAGSCSFDDTYYNHVLDSNKQEKIIDTIFNNRSEYCFNTHVNENYIDRVEFRTKLDVGEGEDVITAPAIIFKFNTPITISFARFNAPEVIEKREVSNELIFLWTPKDLRMLINNVNRNIYDQIVIQHFGYKALVKECFTLISPWFAEVLAHESETPKPPPPIKLSPPIVLIEMPNPTNTPITGNNEIPLNHSIISEVSQAISRLTIEMLNDKINSNNSFYHPLKWRKIDSSRARDGEFTPPNLVPHRNNYHRLFDIDDYNLASQETTGMKTTNRLNFLYPKFND